MVSAYQEAMDFFLPHPPPLVSLLFSWTKWSDDSLTLLPNITGQDPPYTLGWPTEPWEPIFA